MDDLIVYTSIHGGYDTPKPPRPHPRVSEWRLYTDDPNLYAPGWTVIFDLDLSEFPSHRLRAKYRKCHPPWTQGGVSLWLDGSIRVYDPALIDAVLELLDGTAEWVMYRHPERGRLRDELAASLPMRKYAGQPMEAQVRHYEERLPVASLGLWAGGIIGRKHTENVLAAGAHWWAEQNRWTLQDQLSLPVVLHAHDVKVEALWAGGGLWNNELFTVERHASDL